MNTKKENDILEITLSIAESGYAEAYRFLAEAYENDAGNFGPQTLYFLACLAGGAGMPQKALAWIRKAVADNGWWYRPEVLEDDDLELLKDNAEFIALKAVSGGRYVDAAAKTKEVFRGNGRRQTNCSLPSMATHKMDKRREMIGKRCLTGTANGR